ncbi:substrate-binding periplasmic protein [Neptunicella sp.]|uniref:substrate-binding periplasmic protein n=1 Tax=Neptunicella sp. TaxID=2125986 RepID=UPI003F68E1C2
MKIFATKLFFILVLTSNVYAGDTQPHSLRYISNVTNDNDPQKGYFVDLLQLAISASAEHYQLQPIYLPMNQQRQVRYLDSGNMDVMWSMTSKEREQQALPIRIPLMKGLLGYRIFVIRKKDQPRFERISHTSELKKFTAIQGNGWPDVEILKYNGLPVETTYWYKAIYKTLSAGHFDYFPRSVLEAHSELSHYQFDNLAIESRHVLYYRSAIYYFVKNGNTQLANAIEKGLRILIADGRFDKLLFEFPEHKIALEQAHLADRTIHKLDNPYLSDQMPEDPALWYAGPQ